MDISHVAMATATLILFLDVVLHIFLVLLSLVCSLCLFSAKLEEKI